MRSLSATAFACLLPLCMIMGCGGTSAVEGDPSVVLDSLQAENARLQAENRILRDSLQFQDDLETGQYYRKQRTLQDRIVRLTYEVRRLREGGLTVTQITADSLFKPASANLSAEGTERLRTVAAQLQQTYPNRTIRVEGHADPSPLGSSLKEKYDSNWELSCARASAVVRQLIAESNLDRSQFVAAGYGATRPRVSNETASGRRRNRRVRVAVLPTPRDYASPFETSW